MAHMIDMTNDRANIAFVGVTPWHGLGQELQQGAPIETWLNEAGLDWTAERSKILFETDGRIVAGKSEVIYRSDTFTEIGVVSDRYKIVQPKEVLEFYRDLVATQGWTIDVAGSLDGGKRIWALAKTGDGFNVNGTVDRVNSYLLLATSFDGSMATVGKFTSIRTVCQNTLTMSLNDGQTKIAVPHSANFNQNKVKESLGIYHDVTSQFAESATRLANRKVKDSEAIKFIKDIIVGKDVEVDDLSTRASNIVTSIFSKFKGSGAGSQLSTADGTLWGVVNAITEHNTHNAGHNANNRLRSNWFGQNEKISMTAFEEALEMC